MTTRRQLLEQYVTAQTAPTYAETMQRAFEGRLVAGSLTTEETVEVLLRGVRALYNVGGWLADELDKVEAAIPVR
jgi:hypothetical protein